MRIFEYLGRFFIGFFEKFGEIGIFLYHILYWLFRGPVYPRMFFKDMVFIGVRSSSIILLTGLFTGMVSSLQSYYGFNLFGAQALVGSTVALGLLRELGPVLAALMVTARAGSAISAELGTMRVTEQIDALSVMGVNPYQYLIIPKIAAGIIVLPMLTLLFDAIGMVGSYLVGVDILGIDKGMFMAKILDYVDYEDLFSGLIKAAFFGAILTIVGCYKGFTSSGGAEGVGKATTESVVISSVSILIADYVLTAIMF
ncbi:MAG: ABC transporter permease [Thermodesulfobacteriota bacterium]|nr:ABC transporter permease [Thermodesulfobacteriota bacterium]